MMLDSPSAEPGFPAKLKRDKNLQPCPAESGDERRELRDFPEPKQGTVSGTASHLDLAP
jgi:hypothetical protein